jgi:hypothetical protein
METTSQITRSRQTNTRVDLNVLVCLTIQMRSSAKQAERSRAGRGTERAGQAAESRIGEAHPPTHAILHILSVQSICLPSMTVPFRNPIRSKPSSEQQQQAKYVPKQRREDKERE